MMRKTIAAWVMALCCLCMAAPAQAQIFKMGVKGGLNFAHLSLDGDLVNAARNSTGFFIGPMAEVSIPVAGLGVTAALMYSERGKADLKQQGIELPVNLRLNMGAGSLLGAYVEAGPSFFFNLKDPGSNLLGTFSKKNAQVGLNLGAGLKLMKHLQVGVNYQIGMGDSFKLKNALAGGSAKYNIWQASLAYIF